MPVKRRRPKARFVDHPAWQIEVLETGTTPDDHPDINPFSVIDWHHLGGGLADPARKVWDECGDHITTDWIKRRAGTRPFAWWVYSAPRCPVGTWPGRYYDGKLAEPRKRLNGTGTPAHEVLAYGPSFCMGIPTMWVTQRQADIYNGRTRDIHGNQIEKWKGGHYKEGDFKGEAIDPDDPPVFESQAAYLDRHKLLSDDEREALPGDAFEPVLYVPADL